VDDGAEEPNMNSKQEVLLMVNIHTKICPIIKNIRLGISYFNCGRIIGFFPT
jgi:hypothetical protein